MDKYFIFQNFLRELAQNANLEKSATMFIQNKGLRKNKSVD